MPQSVNTIESGDAPNSFSIEELKAELVMQPETRTPAQSLRHTDRASWIQLIREEVATIGGIDLPEQARHTPRMTNISPAWPDDDMVGAEYDAWKS